MKTTHALAAIYIAAAPVAFSQGGPLTPPPGAPAPTMKTLNQVEPRIPVVAGAPGVTIDGFGGVTISQRGSYYLTNDVNYTGAGDGIRITASGVTLDMMGYAVVFTGVGNSDDAIEILADHVTVSNGRIHSTTTYDGTSFTLGGFGWGIYCVTKNVQVRNLAIHGTRSAGINLGPAYNIAENITCAEIAGTAIEAQSMKSCVATNVGVGLTGGRVSNSEVSAVGVGIAATVVENCRATSQTGSAISGSGVNASVRGCQGVTTGTTVGSHGISCVDGLVVDSVGQSAGGHGINASTVTSSHGITSGNHENDSCGIRAKVVNGSNGLRQGSDLDSGRGILADLVTDSRGEASNPVRGGVGIQATLGKSCIGGGAFTNRYDMP